MVKKKQINPYYLFLGVKKTQGTGKLKEIFGLIKQGKSAESLKSSEETEVSFARNHNYLGKRIAARDVLLAGKRRPRKNILVKVFWGPTGTAKTQKALDECWDAGLIVYIVGSSTGSVFYDYIDSEFDGEKIGAILFDDYYGAERYSNLLRMLGGTTVMLQIKGKMILMPDSIERIYFTSNAYVTDWYPNIHEKEYQKNGTHLSALARRIDEIEHITEVYIGTEVGTQVKGVILTPSNNDIVSPTIVHSRNYRVPSGHENCYCTGKNHDARCKITGVNRYPYKFLGGRPKRPDNLYLWSPE